MKSKQVVYFGTPIVMFCDGQCQKAWGINGRPKRQLSANEDDYEFLADGELGNAPLDTGSWEGGDGKPSEFPLEDANRMNKWCLRECERCSFKELKTFVEPVRNIRI